jgi:hypothetical protein
MAQPVGQPARRLAFLLALGGLVPGALQGAPRDTVVFEGLQSKCVNVPSLAMPGDKHSPQCRVTRGRWFVTLDFLDQYQVQYCYGTEGQGCASRALLLFSNRAYTPDARLLVHSAGPGDTRYDDPLVVSTGRMHLMELVARSSSGVGKSYFVWRSPRWVALDSHAWLREVAARLPRGSSVEGEPGVDLDTMTSRVLVSGREGRKSMNVQLELSGLRFKVKSIASAGLTS